MDNRAFHEEYERLIGCSLPAKLYDGVCSSDCKNVTLGDYVDSCLVKYSPGVCSSCKANLYEGMYQFQEFSDKSFNKVTLASAKDLVWYHATWVPQWRKKIFKDGLVSSLHAGNRLTAIIRAKDAESEFRGNSGLVMPKIFKLRLKPEVKLRKRPIDDCETAWDEMYPLKPRDMYSYVNGYEFPGSVSLYGDPNMFEVIGESYLNLEVFERKFAKIRARELRSLGH